MSTTRRISLTCPNCTTGFAMSASRVRPGAWLPCPECFAPVHLDAADPVMAEAIEAARSARRERRIERSTLQRDWRVSPPALFATAEYAPSGDLDTVLSGLDSLLGRLDELMLRQRGAA
jgi:hypothetical protein